MKLQITHQYDDIIRLQRPESGRRARMSLYDRAAQFSPFAALKGFDDAIAETGRQTQDRIELDRDALDRLDEQMQGLLEVLDSQPEAEVVWFRYDERKAGGSYVTTTGHVKKVDTYLERMIFTDGRSIPLGEVLSVTVMK